MEENIEKKRCTRNLRKKELREKEIINDWIRELERG